MNGSRYAALVHAANCITLHLALLPLVKILKIANGTLWQSTKTCWNKPGQELGVNMFKIS
jgi:hypothetical protein